MQRRDMKQMEQRDHKAQIKTNGGQRTNWTQMATIAQKNMATKAEKAHGRNRTKRPQSPS